MSDATIRIPPSFTSMASHSNGMDDNHWTRLSLQVRKIWG